MLEYAARPVGTSRVKKMLAGRGLILLAEVVLRLQLGFAVREAAAKPLAILAGKTSRPELAELGINFRLPNLIGLSRGGLIFCRGIILSAFLSLESRVHKQGLVFGLELLVCRNLLAEGEGGRVGGSGGRGG